MADTAVPSDDHDYYALATYWNAFDPVMRYQNRMATGDDDTPWWAHLHANFGSFERVLSLNCGNGWVERGLVERGVVKGGVGIDIAEASLAEARAAADAAGLDLRYQRHDINLDPLPDGPFDLIVNHAAGHHIANIDAVFRQVCERLAGTGGLFVSVDYVGPHRNQYRERQWHAAGRANADLPPQLRQQMVYPHIQTMLALDPTEAIHAELILPTLQRYFDLEHYRPMGGAIGYLVITHNRPFFELPGEEVIGSVERLVALDEAYTQQHPEDTLFAYAVARPRPAALANRRQLDRWTAEELRREVRAARAGGRYYPPTPLERESYPAPRVPLRTTVAARLPRAALLYRAVKRSLSGSAAVPGLQAADCVSEVSGTPK
jgi:SAM-dependent methyltransferase